MRRGDVVTTAMTRDYGKPRPAVVVQDDAFAALESVTVLRITSDTDHTGLMRIAVVPTSKNGLRVASRIMIDKAATVPRSKIGHVVGRLDPSTMDAVDSALSRFLGLRLTP